MIEVLFFMQIILVMIKHIKFVQKSMVGIIL